MKFASRIKPEKKQKNERKNHNSEFGIVIGKKTTKCYTYLSIKVISKMSKVYKVLFVLL